MIPENRRKLLIAKWQGVNSLLTYFGGSKTEGDSLSEDSATLHEIRWNIDVQNSVTRQLLNETHGIFMDFQELCENERPELDVLLKTSLQYRAVIQSCIVKLRENLRSEKRKEFYEGVKEQLDLFSTIEMIWHLCEVLLIRSPSGGYCLKPLLSWIKWHYNDVDQLGQGVISSEDPYSHVDYWPTVYGFVLQGRLDEVCDLLMHHPQRDQSRFDAFASIEELLKKMPIFQVYEGQSVNDFNAKWNEWHAECLLRLQDGDFAQYLELECICQLLCGQDSVFLTDKNLCQSWYQVLVAKVLYSDPGVQTFNLKYYAEECMEMFNDIGNVSALDEIVLSVISADVHTVINKCSETFSNWWFVSHLTDLLFHCNLLKSHDLDYGDDLREFLLLEYSSSLMAHSSLWNIAADYLMCCPVSGRGHLATYIGKIPLTCEKKALKLIRLCDKYGFTEQGYSICKVMGMNALRHQRLGVSLSWCMRAKDEEFASLLTGKFLNHYMKTGTFIECDLIDNLGSSMLLNNKLTFLGKYYEFHKLYMADNYKEAGSLLVSLLTSNFAPKKFWIILLIDALPLLEHKEIIFSSDQTFELMQCMKELQLCYHPTNNNNKKKNKVWEDDEKDQMELLHLGLTRNLSRSLLINS